MNACFSSRWADAALCDTTWRDEIGIKIYGDDLDLLRQKAELVQAKMKQVPGVADALLEPQALVPQLRIEWDRNQLLRCGPRTSELNEYVQTAMNGRVVSQVLDGMRTFDLVVRMKEDYREDIDELKRLSIQLPEAWRSIPKSEIRQSRDHSFVRYIDAGYLPRPVHAFSQR